MCFVMQKSGELISENQLHEILSEVDLNKNAQVDLGEFLQVSWQHIHSISMSCQVIPNILS